MDYTTVPRSLIYRDRRSMIEFSVYDADSITRPLAEAMVRLDIIQHADSENRALWCMNTAFYICTMILLETDPRWRLSDYKRIARPNWNFQPEQFQILTLSLAALLLSRLEDSLPLMSKKGQTRNHIVSLMLVESGEFNEIFKNLFEQLKNDPFISPTIPNSSFAPRVIDKECVHDVMSEKDFNWVKFTNYWEERSVKDIVKALGTIEDEKHNVVEILRQSSHGFYAAGCNDSPGLKDAMFDEIDEEIRLQFNPNIDKALAEAPPEELKYQGDVRPLQARIVELETQLGNSLSNDKVNPEYIESLNRQLAEEKDKNAKLEAEINQLKEILELDKKMESDQKRLQIDERIILISTALGTPWNSDMTNQTQLAKIIEHFSGDDWKSIRSRIVAINSELKQELATPGEGLSQGTKEAISNVIDWLAKATRGERNTQTTDTLIKEIKDVFLNTKE